MRVELHAIVINSGQMFTEVSMCPVLGGDVSQSLHFCFFVKHVLCTEDNRWEPGTVTLQVWAN